MGPYVGVDSLVNVFIAQSRWSPFKIAESHCPMSPYVAFCPEWLFTTCLSGGQRREGGGRHTDKKKKKSSYIRKFRRDRLQSHRRPTVSSYKVKYLRFYSYIRKPFLNYMTFQPILSGISLCMRKILFSFLSVQQPAFNRQYLLIA